MVHSAHSIVLLALFDVALPGEREKPSWIVKTVEISPFTHWVLLIGSPRVGRVFERAITQPIVCYDPWHHDIDQLCICALTLARALATATCCARQRACCSRFLNISTAQEGFSLCCWLLLLASYSMVLTREHKNPSRIAWQIKIFSIFAWLIPT